MGLIVFGRGAFTPLAGAGDVGVFRRFFVGGMRYHLLTKSNYYASGSGLGSKEIKAEICPKFPP
jgi:hypothetical protein